MLAILTVSTKDVGDSSPPKLLLPFQKSGRDNTRRWLVCVVYSEALFDESQSLQVRIATTRE